MTPSILIACVGNIFLGDDAFGVEVASRLSRRSLPQQVKLVDFGIRGIDLTYALLEDYKAVILVDALPRGGQPGTLYLLEPDLSQAQASQSAPMETHNMDPVKVLQAATALGAHLNCLRIVGVEPSSTGSDEQMPSGLSPPVAAAVEQAVVMIESLITQLLNPEPSLVRT